MQRIFSNTPRQPSFRTGQAGLGITYSDADFIISPALGGETSWSLVSDGPLNIGATGEYTITPTRDVTVSAKMWGAGGGRGYAIDGNTNNRQGPGGGGGYSSATIILRVGVPYILRVGQGGARISVSGAGPQNATYLAGGLGADNTGPQGGGYSGIFRTSVSQANALLIAGGGGGGGDEWYYGTGARAGGGTTGQSTDGFVVASSQWGEHGTASAGGRPSPYNTPTAGSALTGGRSQNQFSGVSMGAGGGGYWGGGGGNAGGGGGGSGVAKTDADVSSGSTSTGSYDTPANEADAARSGSGRGGNGVSPTGADGRIILTGV